ncbi:MAG: hypothetical protein F2667_12855 [Actinobacteria bacterium]|uniref:Unannotated protein n=1 Tax=freshwater metagenome TaxID=449393 RepID=A0A6J6S2F0_9ZZZZ|nr:hypothetical protein [Actinomycetota bacterium]
MTDPTVPVPARHRLVVVTGSGRSGTSSVAGTLKRLGVHIPQPEVEADERNPLGYYEPQWVAQFHKAFLNAVPVRTIDARPDAGEIAMAAVTPEIESELRAWLGEELARHEPGTPIAVKETRAYWVFPLWLRIAAELDADVSSLTMLRHPAQVVRSRDTAYLTESSESFRRRRETTNVAAWVNSIFATERATRERPRAFVPYVDLVGDWRSAITRACDQLDLATGDLTAPHPVDEFVTTSLNRSSPDWDGLVVSDALVDLAERTWATAQRLVTAPHDAQAIADLDRLHEEYVAMYESASAIALDATAAQVASLRKRLAAKSRRIDKLRAELETLRAGAAR